MATRPRSRPLSSRLLLRARAAARAGRVRCVAAAVAAAAVAGGASLGYALQDPPAEPAVGLAGLTPMFPPDALTADAFGALDGNWADWSGEAAAEVAELYALDGTSVEEQRAAVAAVRKRIKTLDRALLDPAYRMIWPEMARVRGPMALRADLFGGALDVLTGDARAAARPQTDAAASDLRSAVSAVRAHLDTVAGGGPWVGYLGLNAVEASLASGGGDQGAVERLARRLDPASAKNDAQRNFLDLPVLGEAAAAANRYLAVTRLAEQGADPDAVRERLGDLIVAIDAQEASPTDEAAARILAARAALDDAAGPLADPLDRVLRTYYLNYNIRLVADEKLLSQLVNTQEVNSGAITDRFMGATIRGSQTTRAEAALRIVPSDDVARFDFALTGVANSRTNAFTPQATISSVGTTQFVATKPVAFDGHQFSTAPADLSINPSIRHVGAATKYDNILFGLFKGAIRRRAISEANARMPASRAHAASEAREQLLPRFNQEVDDNFATVNGDLAGLTSRAEGLGVGPRVVRSRTTDDRFLYDLVVRGSEEVSGSPPTFGSTRGVGFTLQLHESLLNNAADTWGFAGRTMTTAEVQADMEKWFSTLLGKPVKFTTDEPRAAGQPKPAETREESTLIFADRDPIRFKVARGALILVLRAGIKGEDGKEDIPPQIVEVPLNLSVVGDDVRLDRGVVIVSPLEAPPGRAVQIARAGVMRRKIENGIKGGTRTRTIVLDRNDRPSVTVRIERIDAESGWLTVYGA